VATITSCKKEVPLSFTEMHFVSEEDAIIEINIPKFEEGSEISRKINETLERFVANSIITKEEKVYSIKEASKTFGAEFVTFSEELFEDAQPWEAFVDGEVTYQTSEIICIAINTYTNTGGAHGNSVISFLNFNPLNGELYKNTALFNNIDDLKIIAASHFNKMIKDEDIDQGNFKFPETIGFNEDGIIILLNSNGLIVDSPEFTIPFEAINDLLKVH